MRRTVLAIGATATVAATTIATSVWQQKEAEYHREIAEYIQDKSGTVEIPKDMEQKFFRDVIVPQLQAVHKTGNCKQREAAVLKFTLYLRQLGFMQENSDLMPDLAEYGLADWNHELAEVCMDEALLKCVDQYDLNQVRVIMEYAQQAQLMGVNLDDGGRSEKCLRFELEWEAEYFDPNEYMLKTTATIPLQLKDEEHPRYGATKVLSGTAMPTAIAVAYAPNNPGCQKWVTNVGAQPVRIAGLRPRTDSVGLNLPYDLEIDFDPGDVEGSKHIHCPGSETQTQSFDGVYRSAFMMNMKDQKLTEGFKVSYVFMFKPEEIRPEGLNTSLWARKEINRVLGDTHAKVKVTIWHRPQL